MDSSPASHDMDEVMPTRYAFETTAAVHVIIGDERRIFIIHPDILCKQSKFFQSACSQRWNAEQKPIVVQETMPQTFNDYLTLVYRDKVAKAEEVQSYFARLIRLYLLADKLGDLKSANKAIDRIIKFSDRNVSAPEYGAVAMVMAETPENSPLRRLMVDFYVHEVTANSFDEDDTTYPHGFHALVAKEFVKMRNGDIDETPIKYQPRCHYHQHDASCPKREENEDGEDESNSQGYIWS